MAGVGRMGASVEAFLAELAVLPLGVFLAVQAGAWGRDRSTSSHLGSRNWSRTFGARLCALNYQSSQVISDALWPKHDPGLLRPSDGHAPLHTHMYVA